MENKLNNKEAILLPFFFKKIGLLIMASAIFTGIDYKIANTNLAQPNDTMKILTMNGLILGLFLIAWSRDKIEDELTIQIRLKAIAWAFSWGVIYVIITPLIDIIFQDPIQSLSAHQLILSMLIVYIIMYYMQKRNR